MSIQKNIFVKRLIHLFISITLFHAFVGCQDSNQNDLKNTIIVISDLDNSSEKIAAQVLSEEVDKRTGFKWEISTNLPEKGNTIVLSSNNLASSENIKPEGYNLKSEKDGGRTKISISAEDGRGVLYGVGKFLRMLEWKKGEASFSKNIDITSSPVYPMRGHQIAYRTLANSYDAWTPEIYDQYIRDLALFGTNSIEMIPTGGRGPLMKYDPLEMNTTVSEICDKYDMDFWFMTGTEMDLSDVTKRDEVVARLKKEINVIPKLDGLFFSGGDPGISHPKYVMPLLEELAAILKQKHPETKIWFSLQDFDEEEIDFFFNYINSNMPDWFGGLVSGPASPWMPASRERLPEKYKLRHYPDITHSCRSQYPVSWLVLAFALLLGL